jgi:inorganic pyrophosphatase
MTVHNIGPGKKFPNEIYVVLEIPKGSKNKYEFNEEFGLIELDRVNYTAMAHPYDYGFIPGTRSEDGDHLDAFVLLDNSAFPGALVSARPVGVLFMVDDGEKDEKIIAVPSKDPRYNHIKDLSDLSPHIKKEIEHFFLHYKDLQKVVVELKGWGNSEKAKDVIEKSREVSE